MAVHTNDIEQGLLRVNPRGVISLPEELRGNTNLFSAVKRADGVIELHPKIVIDESQAWFWTERWQRMEQEAQADLEAGRLREYEGDDEMFADLEARRPANRPIR